MATQKERRTSPRKPAAKDVPRAANRPADTKPLSNQDLYKLIAETAYFKARKRDFAPGGEVQDWIEAEAEVHVRLAPGRSSH